MKYEQHVKDIYKIAGMLEALSLIPGQTITVTPGLAADLEDAVDKLELIGAQLANEGYTITMDIQPPSCMVDFFDDKHMRLLCDRRPMKKVVNAHEGTEDSPLNRSRPIYKRPGRCVCICTAKGKIIYLEDRFEYNKQNQRR